MGGTFFLRQGPYRTARRNASSVAAIPGAKAAATSTSSLKLTSALWLMARPTAARRNSLLTGKAVLNELKKKTGKRPEEAQARPPQRAGPCHRHAGPRPRARASEAAGSPTSWRDASQRLLRTYQPRERSVPRSNSRSRSRTCNTYSGGWRCSPSPLRRRPPTLSVQQAAESFRSAKRVRTRPVGGNSGPLQAAPGRPRSARAPGFCSQLPCAG